MARRSGGSGGFTLMELVAVMVVLVLLAVVAMPSLSSLGSTRETKAAWALQADVLHARRSAVSCGRRHWVVFDGLDVWRILEEPAGGGGRASAVAVSDPVDGSVYTVMLGVGAFAGVSIQSVDVPDGTEIGFDWIGRPWVSDGEAMSGNATVTFSAGTRVVVEAETGLVSVEPGN